MARTGGWLRRILTILAILAASVAHAASARLTGDFASASADLDPAQSLSIFHETEVWETWHRGQTQMGRLEYGPFTLKPDHPLTLWINGFPNLPDQTIEVRNDRDGSALRLRVAASPAGSWARYRWDLPQSFHGVPLTLVAIDASPADNHWLGVSPPVRRRAGEAEAGWLVLRQVGVFAALLLPGLAVMLWLPERIRTPEHRLLGMLLIAGLVHHAMVYVYLGSPRVGPWVAEAAGVAAALAVLGRWRRCAGWLSDPAFALPVAFAAVAGAAYLLLGLAYGGATAPTAVPISRWFPELPPDYLLPDWFAEKLAHGEPLRPFFLDWLTSDRPPLQTGMTLALWPISASRLTYLQIGIAAQSWVWIGFWVLLRRLAVPARALAYTLALGATSAVFFVHTFYCWPKLLPAAYLLIAAGLLCGELPPSRRDVSLAAIAGGLAMLGHGGSVFGLAGIGAVFLALRCRGLRWRFTLEAAALGVLTLLPWLLYQHFVDPPGDRLIKYHLGMHPDLDPRPALTVIAEAYRHLGWRGTIAAKAGAFRFLFHGIGDWLRSLGDWNRFVWATRHAQYLYYWLVLGPGWFGVAGAWRGAKGRDPALRRAGRVVGMLFLASLLAWVLAVFDGATAIQNSCYFLFAMLLAAAALAAQALPPVLRGAILAANLAWLVGIWGLEPDRRPGEAGLFPSSQPGYWVVAALLAAALAAIACKTGTLSAPASTSGDPGTSGPSFLPRRIAIGRRRESRSAGAPCARV